MNVTTQEFDKTKALDVLNSRNIRNRLLDRFHVTFLAGEMKRGVWRFNGDPIRFDQDGNLVDGQHRLAAIVRSDTVQKFIVLDGIDAEAMPTIDTGKRRSAGDVLSIAGYTHGRVLAAIINVHIRYNKVGYARQLGAGERPSNEEVLKLAPYFIDINDSINYVQKHQISNKHGKQSQWCYLHYVLGSETPAIEAKRDAFFEQALEGLNLDAKSPTYLLFKKLQRNATRKPGTGGLSRYEIWAAKVRCWNYFVRGKTVKALPALLPPPKIILT